MHIRYLTLSLFCAAGLAQWGPAEATTRIPTDTGAAVARSADTGRGIQWETSLAAAQAKARRTGKPLFLLHLFGKLNEPFC